MLIFGLKPVHSGFAGPAAGSVLVMDSWDKACTMVQTKCQAPAGVSRDCFRRQGTPSPSKRPAP